MWSAKTTRTKSWAIWVNNKPKDYSKKDIQTALATIRLTPIDVFDHNRQKEELIKSLEAHASSK